MTMQARQLGETTIIALSGRLDGMTMSEVEEQFLALIEQGRSRFVFDMSGLEYISSAGLRVMLLAVKKTRAAGGKLALFAVTGNVDEVFQMSGFSTIFAIFATEEEALSYIAAS